MVRAGHPLAKRKALTRETYLSHPHIFVARTSNAHQLLETTLLALGLHRDVALQVPHFLVAPHILQRSNLICTIPNRIAQQLNRHAEFRVFSMPVPVPVPSADVAVHWHSRCERDPGNRWMRELIIRLFKE